MIKAAVERVSRQSVPPGDEPPRYLLDYQNTNNPTSLFKGDATTTPSPLGARSKQSNSSSRNNKRPWVNEHSSMDSSTAVHTRNPSNSDWNSRRRSDQSGLDSYVSSQRQAADPPRPAKDGMEWVWFPAGYWAERERVETSSQRGDSPKRWFNRSPSSLNRRTSSAATQRLPDIVTHFSQSLEVPRLVDALRKGSDTSGLSKGSDAESRLERLRLGFSYMSPTYPHFVSPSGEPEGLYCKTRRNVEGRLVPKRNTSTEEGSPFSKGVASQTTMVLEGASGYFERSQKERNEKMRGHLEAATPISPGSPGPRSRRFGLAPWHRRTSIDSLFSVTSSVHKLLQGKTPLGTPDAASIYGGKDGQSYPKVDISDTAGTGPNFLPSEAKRLSTPPMSPGTPDTTPRGFFFSLSSQGPESKSPAGSRSSKRSPRVASSTGSKSPRVSSNGDTPTSATKEWWDMEHRHSLSPGKSKKKRPSKLVKGPLLGDAASPPISQFELNIPEHLPSSPLCPKHPKYVGKGNGMCVYHGRQKGIPKKGRVDSGSRTAIKMSMETAKGEYETG